MKSTYPGVRFFNEVGGLCLALALVHLFQGDHVSVSIGTGDDTGTSGVRRGSEMIENTKCEEKIGQGIVSWVGWGVEYGRVTKR